MAKLTIRKGKDGTFAVLPEEMAGALSDGQEIEIFPMRDGIYLLAMQNALDGMLAKKMPAQIVDAKQAEKSQTQGAQKSASVPKIGLTPDEEAVARKLYSIRYENRVVPQVEGMLNAAEKKALLGIIQKKLITIGKSAKYPKGVYNITDVLYGAMRGAPAAHGQQSRGQPQVASPPINTLAHLKKLGYMVLDNENEARTLTPELQEAIKSSDVKGVRGFDKKYYVLVKSFFEEHGRRLLQSLEESPKTAEQMAPELHLTPEGVRTLLIVLAEEGEVMEKAKGVWKRA